MQAAVPRPVRLGQESAASVRRFPDRGSAAGRSVRCVPVRWASIERRAAKDPKFFPEALGPGADEHGRARTQNGPGGDGVDRGGFALGAAGLPPGRPGLANGEALHLKQARQPCPVGARPLDRHQDDPGRGAAADPFHRPAHACPGGGKRAGPDHRYRRGGQHRERVGFGVSTPTTCAYCSATMVICLLLPEEVRSEPAGRITLRQISNESRSTTGAKRTAFYQAIVVGRLLPGPPCGQGIYKTPQAGQI
jgi:hypothetical protein